MHTTNMLAVPFSKLVPGNIVNARGKADRGISIDELAAQIKAKGLIQPLAVRPIDGDKFEVMAGNRRLRAITKLVQKKDWPADAKIACTVRPENDHDALETSLIENIGRAPMHPVDEFEVFAKLNSDGQEVSDIAKRYGIGERDVHQRLALGSLAPGVRKAWRAGGIDADTAKAFAINPDKKLQERVFKDLQKDDRLYVRHVRAALTDDKPKLNDKRLKFVGLDRYREAGGGVVEDLFGEDGYLENPELLDQLVAEALERKRDELLAEGWSWVEIGNVHNHWQLPRIRPAMKLTDEEKLQIVELEAKLEKLREEEDGTDWDAEEGLEAQIEAIRDAAQVRAFTPAHKKKSGCILRVEQDGVAIDYGLQRVDTKKAKAKANGLGRADEAEPADDGISNALLTDLTDKQTHAAARALMANPDLAVRLIIAGMSCAGFTAPIKLRREGHPQLQGEHRHIEFSARLAELDDEADLSQVLAAEVGKTFDLRTYNGQSQTAGRKALVAALPGEAYLESMRELFDAEDYFKRTPARVAVAAIGEMGSTQPSSAKKADIAAHASAEAKRLGWLPPELRHPDYELLQPKKGKARA